MAKREWDVKFALAGRGHKSNQDRAEKSKKGWGLNLWSSRGSKHNKGTNEREQEAVKPVESVVVAAGGSNNAQLVDGADNVRGKSTDGAARKSRSQSRQRSVIDEGQTKHTVKKDEATSAIDVLATRKPDAPTKQDNQELKDKEVQQGSQEAEQDTTEKSEKEEVKGEKVKSEEGELSSRSHAPEVLKSSETPVAKAESEQPIIVKKPGLETERMKPDSSVLGIRVVTENALKADAQKSDSVSSPEKAIPAEAKHEGLDVNSGLLKSPTVPLSPLADKVGDESLTKYDSKSPVDKHSFDKSPSKFNFDQSAPKLNVDKAEAEEVKSESPPLKTVTITESSPPAVKETTPTKTKPARPLSFLASGLKRALTKRSAKNLASDSSPTHPVGNDTHVIKSSDGDRETNEKELEANEKAHNSVVGVQKSLSTRDPKRTSIAKTSTWKADEASTGRGLRPQPSVSKKSLPMLKRDYVPPPTTLNSLGSMAEDDELLKPSFPKGKDADAISDYLTW